MGSHQEEKESKWARILNNSLPSPTSVPCFNETGGWLAKLKWLTKGRSRLGVFSQVKGQSPCPGKVRDLQNIVLRL